MQVITPLSNLDGFPGDGRGITPCLLRGERIGGWQLVFAQDATRQRWVRQPLSFEVQ